MLDVTLLGLPAASCDWNVMLNGAPAAGFVGTEVAVSLIAVPAVISKALLVAPVRPDEAAVSV